MYWVVINFSNIRNQHPFSWECRKTCDIPIKIFIWKFYLDGLLIFLIILLLFNWIQLTLLHSKVQQILEVLSNDLQSNFCINLYNSSFNHSKRHKNGINEKTQCSRKNSLKMAYEITKKNCVNLYCDDILSEVIIFQKSQIYEAYAFIFLFVYQLK